MNHLGVLRAMRIGSALAAAAQGAATRALVIEVLRAAAPGATLGATVIAARAGISYWRVNRALATLEGLRAVAVSGPNNHKRYALKLAEETAA